MDAFPGDIRTFAPSGSYHRGVARVSRAQRFRIPALVVGIVLVSAAVLGLLLTSLQQVKARAVQDRILSASADREAEGLSRYFGSNRSAALLLTQGPGFSGLLADGAEQRRAREQVNSTLVYLANLFPNSITTAGVVAADGRELARVSDGTYVTPGNLSDATRAPYVEPALSLPIGEAVNTKPYLASTGDRVISVATPVRLDGGERVVVHFEVTLTSFIDRLAPPNGLSMAILDATTGRTVQRGDVPAALGISSGGDRVTVPGYTSGLSTIGESRVAFAPVPAGSENANRWLVASVAPPYRPSRCYPQSCSCWSACSGSPCCGWRPAASGRRRPSCPTLGTRPCRPRG